MRYHLDELRDCRKLHSEMVWIKCCYWEFPTAFPTESSFKISDNMSHKIFPQAFSCKFIWWNNFLQDCPTACSHKILTEQALSSQDCSILIFPQQWSINNGGQAFQARFSHKILPHQVVGSYGTGCHKISHKMFATIISHKIFQLHISRNNFLEELNTTTYSFAVAYPTRGGAQEFPTRCSHNNLPQDFPATISFKIFFPDFPELDTEWVGSPSPYSKC